MHKHIVVVYACIINFLYIRMRRRRAAAKRQKKRAEHRWMRERAHFKYPSGKCPRDPSCCQFWFCYTFFSLTFASSASTVPVSLCLFTRLLVCLTFHSPYHISRESSLLFPSCVGVWIVDMLWHGKKEAFVVFVNRDNRANATEQKL